MKKVILCSQNNLLTLHFHPRLQMLNRTNQLGLQVEIRSQTQCQTFHVSFTKNINQNQRVFLEDYGTANIQQQLDTNLRYLMLY